MTVLNLQEITATFITNNFLDYIPKIAYLLGCTKTVQPRIINAFFVNSQLPFWYLSLIIEVTIRLFLTRVQNKSLALTPCPLVGTVLNTSTEQMAKPIP